MFWRKRKPAAVEIAKQLTFFFFSVRLKTDPVLQTFQQGCGTQVRHPPPLGAVACERLLSHKYSPLFLPLSLSALRLPSILSARLGTITLLPHWSEEAGKQTKYVTDRCKCVCVYVCMCVCV